MHPAYCTLAETTYLSCNYTKVTTCEIFIVLKVPDRHSGWWLGLCGQYTGGDPSQPLPSCLPKLPIFTVYNIQWKHYFYCIYIYINIYIWKFWFWCLLLSSIQDVFLSEDPYLANAAENPNSFTKDMLKTNLSISSTIMDYRSSIQCELVPPPIV